MVLYLLILIGVLLGVTAELPAIGWLGGKHKDINVLWMQINDGGQISAKITTQLEKFL